MNTPILRTLILAAVTACGVFAQFGPGDLSGTRTAADPAAMIANRVAYLKALLTLTDAQATQATTIFTTQAAATTTINTSISAARTSLKTAVQANNTANIESLSLQIGTSTGQLIAAQSKASAAFYALLTADQKTRYDALGAGGGGRGPGGGGGHR